MEKINSRPSLQTVADNQSNLRDYSKEFAAIRKDLNELIIISGKIFEQLVKNHGGCQ